MRVLLAWLTISALAALGACGNGTDPDTEAVRPPTTSEAITTVESTESTDAKPDVENLVDELYEALVDADPDRAVALFTAGGVFVDKFGTPHVGASEVRSYVQTVGAGITACERTGPIEVVEPGSYTFPMAFTYRGRDYAEDVSLTLDDDGLIVRHEWSETP